MTTSPYHRVQAAVRHTWGAVNSGKFCVSPDTRKRVEMQPGFFCVHHVLQVHFPFSKTVFITHPLFTARLCWRCSVDDYFPFNQGRRRHLSYPRGCPSKHGGNLLTFSTFEDQSLFEWHPIADTVQAHSAKNGLCSRYLLADAAASHDPDVHWP